ncbi:MAG: hypothetical protein KBG28_03550 [Kofleriaceae bacterium]|jgi:hypothetical protein|nr:hypothetical protein [Kofleriaceae bacterium]MBP6835942.1 hypothetical protein [Kofleriaceae bacterium]MBP9203037.1 hypothetical protein [Kofleriaceae bacterium]
MSTDQRIFDRLWTFFSRRRQEPPGHELGPEVRRLELVASAVAGRPMTVIAAPGPGGLRGDTIVVPSRIPSSLAGDVDLALVRVALASLVARDAGSPAPATSGWQRAVQTHRALYRALATAERELPPLHDLVRRVLPRALATREVPSRRSAPEHALEEIGRVAVGGVVEDTNWDAAIRAYLDGDRAEAPPAWASRLAGAEGEVWPLLGWLEPASPAGSAAAGALATPSGGGQQRDGRARPWAKRRQLDERRIDQNPLTHSFEKVHTLEKYQGGRKQIDGSDELADHGAALDELELDEVVVSTSATAGIYRAELQGTQAVTASAAPVAPSVLRYDEWDDAAGRYLPGHCHVHLGVGADAAPAQVAAAAAAARHEFRASRAQVRRALLRLVHAPAWVGRQPDGPELDIDAVVDRRACLASGHNGPTALYRARPPRPTELAVACLIDHSLSADAWVANRRVLDASVAALLALGDALDGLPTITTMDGFCSNTHLDCRITSIKAPLDPWARAVPRLFGLVPQGYTRIGPAIRHGAATLADLPARRRLLIVLSDGRPTDFDRYEGRHGTADVHRAVLEADRDGITTHCVALDPRASAPLARMFGPRGYTLIPRPAALADALGVLTTQALAR